tara:strand:+ start:1767 stop:2606 length:840 start_codon:yes stop_codon:yes gene_type:complete
MDTSREDVGIAVRSAFLRKGTKQRFSLLILVLLSIAILALEKIQNKPFDYFRSFVQDLIYRSSVIVSFPADTLGGSVKSVKGFFDVYDKYNKLKSENDKLKDKISESDFLIMENTQLRKLIDEQSMPVSDLISSRVLIDKDSPYLHSFIINSGSNKRIKNGYAALDGKNFIGRIVDVNFFSSRILLVTDLNSRIPVVIEPSGAQSILYGRGKNKPTLEYLPKNHLVKDDDKVYTSGKEGIFSPGIPIGKVKMEKEKITVLLFSDLDQINFVNVKLESKK